MQVGTVLGLLCAMVGLLACCWKRQWLLGLAMACSFAYVVMDKLLPGTWPALLVDSFVYVNLGLIFIFVYRNLRREQQRLLNSEPLAAD